MRTTVLVHLILLGILASAGAGAAEDGRIAVDGSGTTYPVAVAGKVGDKDVGLTLTGAALRKKAFFKVYVIGSYVEQGVSVRDAAELANKDCAKQLHLVMERDVAGEAMAAAFVDGIGLNYPPDRFAEQTGPLLAFMKGYALKTGDPVRLTHVPGVGLHCRLPGEKEILIKDVPFAVAIWEIYFGHKNIGRAVKDGLASRLPVGEKK